MVQSQVFVQVALALGAIGVIVRERMYWPSLYIVVHDGMPKLALHWADYEAADCVGFGKASDAVIAKFWVSAYTL
jgi:hypothetical protein